MVDTTELVKQLAEQFGLTLDDQRLKALVASYEAAMVQMQAMSVEPNPVPQPTTFTAQWSDQA